LPLWLEKKVWKKLALAGFPPARMMVFVPELNERVADDKPVVLAAVSLPTSLPVREPGHRHSS